MAQNSARPQRDDASFTTHLTGVTRRTIPLLLLPILLLGVVTIARAAMVPTGPHLAGGAEQATTEALTAFAAETLETALTSGGGIEFEIVQTSTITAREGGPLVEIPDPADRTKSLGQAPWYVVGTLIERGFATPDGYWMELIHGPQPGNDAEYDLAASRQAHP